MSALAIRPQTQFVLPPDAEATEPPEARGLARDQVRLLVATPDGVTHTRFRELPRFLRAGDLVVVNTSATLPAAVDGHHRGRPVVVHFSAPVREAPVREAPVREAPVREAPVLEASVREALVREADDPGWWVVELRAPDGSGPVLDALPGDEITLTHDVRIIVQEPADAHPTGTRLWRARICLEGSVPAWLATHGRPISYGYLRGSWPLADYQPVFAREPGSAEMASAGRPFTDGMVTELVTRGIAVAPVLLHTGVSSQELGEGPQVERFRVPLATARQVELARRNGGRIIAVGTTVARALESAAARIDEWTDLVIGPDHPPQVVSGLVTGWHTPEASHLLLLEAVAGAGLVRAAYQAAVDEHYRWHEFGDSCLFLP